MRNKPATDTFEGEYTSNPMSNSTQNDEIGKMEKAIDEGFADSEKFLKGMKTPFDKSSTQNNHETHTACIERIKKEGTSATCCHCNPHDGCTLEMKPTQNDWYDHAVKNPGFKSGLNALKANTHTDWEKRLIKILGAFTQYVQPDVFDAIVDFVKKELADARREVINDRIDRLKLYEVIENIYLSGMYTHDKGILRQYMSDIINVLATLKEETL